ncbi:DUF4037 domain-containing protein [Streptomyces sp. L7]
MFHDGLHQLGPLRHDLRWYPHDVWLHVLAREWQHIAEREAFVGRCGEVGDELGSAMNAAHLTRHLMRPLLSSWTAATRRTTNGWAPPSPARRPATASPRSSPPP